MNSVMMTGLLGVFCAVGAAIPSNQEVMSPSAFSRAKFSAPSYFAMPESAQAMQFLIEAAQPPGLESMEAQGDVTFSGAECSYDSADKCSSTDTAKCSAVTGGSTCSSSGPFCSTDTSKGCTAGAGSCTTLTDDGKCSTKGTGGCSARDSGICTALFNNGQCSAHGSTGHCSVWPGLGGECTTWELAFAVKCSVVQGEGTCSVKGQPYDGGMCKGGTAEPEPILSAR